MCIRACKRGALGRLICRLQSRYISTRLGSGSCLSGGGGRSCVVAPLCVACCRYCREFTPSCRQRSPCECTALAAATATPPVAPGGAASNGARNGLQLAAVVSLGGRWPLDILGAQRRHHSAARQLPIPRILSPGCRPRALVPGFTNKQKEFLKT